MSALTNNNEHTSYNNNTHRSKEGEKATVSGNRLVDNKLMEQQLRANVKRLVPKLQVAVREHQAKLCLTHSLAITRTNKDK